MTITGIMASHVVLLPLLLTIATAIFGQACGHVIYLDEARGIDGYGICWWDGHHVPCCTLNYALEGLHRKNSTQLVIQPGHYFLNYEPTVMMFRWMHDISIVGNVSNPPGKGVSITCRKDAGLSFIESSLISVKNVTFFGCGAVHNSTSRNYTDRSSVSYLQFRAGLYFLFCKAVRFSGVTVTRSNGIGLILYSTVGENTFHDCTFSHNSVSDSDEYSSGGGGVYLEFCYCKPGDLKCSKGGSNIPIEYSSNATYTFNRCNFVNNNGSLDKDLVDLAYITPKEDRHIAFGRGGGLSIFVKGNARHNRILVNQCQFRANTAMWGAGLFVELHDLATNNTITISNSSLMKNQCPMDYHTSGGGARLGYIYYDDTYASHNHIIFDTCLIYHNFAYSGGGVSFYAPREPNSTYSTNTIDFLQCSWWSNLAKFGAAVDLSLWQLVTVGSVVRPILRSCTFQRNHISTTIPGSTVGIGAVFVNSLTILIEKDITFENNDGSALAIASGSVEFLKNCSATFKKNSGRNGGAISLLGYSFIQVHPGTHLVFESNKADHFGGAIFSESVSEENLFASMSGCFIRYPDITLSPNKWNTTFHFKDNNAGGRSNSIYTTSLMTCLIQDSFSNHALEKVFCWNNSSWIYEDSDCSKQIHTAPAQFIESTYSISIFPGGNHEILFKLSDDRNNKISKPQLFAVKSLNQSVTTPNNYITDNTISLYGPPNMIANISIETADPRVLHTTVIVSILPCPPGYVYNESSKACNCTGKDSLVFGGRVVCNGPGLAMAWIKTGTWLGPYGKNDTLVAGEHPYISGPLFTSLIALPKTVDELDNISCQPLNRTGVLCSDCIENFAPAFNSPSFECTECTQLSSGHNWLWYVLIRLLPLIVFFIIVVALHVNLTSGPANAFILFAQVIVTSVDLGDGSAVSFSRISNAQEVFRDLYLVVYGVANLDFFHGLFKPICLAPNIDTLQLISFEYVHAGVPLFLMLIFYLLVELYERGVEPVFFLCKPFHTCFAYLQRRWSIQRSVIDGFATFIILSYTKFTILSFYFLAPTPLIDISGEQIDRVLYYNGNIKYLSEQHLPYFITSLVLSVFFVIIPPLLLLVYPLKALKKCAKSGKCHCRPRCLHGVKTRFNHFLDTFQGCYKDGTNGTRDCRYFAGLYFIFRILLVLVYYTSAPDWILQFLIKQFLFSAAVLLFAVVRPYSEEFYNNLDTAIFTILAFLNVFTLYISYRVEESSEPAMHWYYFAFQYLLIYIPIVYMVCFLARRFWMSYKRKIKHYLRKKPCCKSKSLRLVDSEEPSDDFDELTKRMYQANTYRPPTAHTDNTSDQEKNEESGTDD